MATVYAAIQVVLSEIMKVFIAAQSEIRALSWEVSFCVSPTKMGSVPKGLITENKAAKI